MTPPDRAALLRVPTAAMTGTGLAARRATAVRRLLRGVDPQRLHGVTTTQASARITRDPWLGAWSAGVICTEGLGRFDAPVVGDLGLMRIVARETGRWPEAEETRALVEGYGEWAGLAAMYLLRHPHARTKTGAPAARAA
jgi:3-methyladenine DNA glycosylase/8-oxoguanine DNA glycosylase